MREGSRTAALVERVARVSVGDWLEAFVVANIAFLAVDILIAHAANAFARWEEWIPIAFSGIAPAVLIPGLVSARHRERTRRVALLVGALAIAVGVAGMLLHLGSGFFATQTLRHLVYTAPFVAPLSYVGLGLLLILNRLETPGSLDWSRWVVFLALGGFVGNFGLSLLDHAQNGFFHATEWVAVVAAAFGTSFLLLVVVRPGDVPLRRACGVVLVIEGVVGALGFVLHAWADVFARPGATWRDRFVHGAPVFAPLLFTNLALLAALGLWSLARATDAASRRP